MWTKLILIFVAIVLPTCQLNLKHLMLVNFKLKEVWRPIEYILGFDYKFDHGQVFTEDDWVKQYEEFFAVPKWLAEEKFHDCDMNGNGEIKGKEVLCFWFE